MPDADKCDGRNEAQDAPCVLISANPCMGETSDNCTTETDGEGSVNKCEGPDSGTTLLQDGRWFLAMLDKKIDELQCWCKEMEGEMKNDKLSEEVHGKILSAVGSAHLLMAQKFQQFQGLCMENLNPEACPHPSMQDLAGFWDLLQLAIEDVRARFAFLRTMRAAGWVLETPPDQDQKKKAVSAAIKKRTKSCAPASKGRTTSGNSSEAAERQKQEARKRLQAAKRAAMAAATAAANKATNHPAPAAESGENIEIYIPEAQTRL
uniref:Discs, large (Drosophila) homolog-associated protein 4a n=1 Tax=Eptatretus burgeri TaxID=7764 RepID=A0A8C4QK69_EPTBU